MREIEEIFMHKFLAAFWGLLALAWLTISVAEDSSNKLVLAIPCLLLCLLNLVIVRLKDYRRRGTGTEAAP